MELEEKFKEAIVSKLVIENKIGISYATKECAKIAEEYAIGLFLWLIENGWKTYLSHESSLLLSRAISDSNYEGKTITCLLQLYNEDLKTKNGASQP